jgi:hypothetical protein
MVIAADFVGNPDAVIEIVTTALREPVVVGEIDTVAGIDREPRADADGVLVDDTDRVAEELPVVDTDSRADAVGVRDSLGLLDIRGLLVLEDDVRPVWLGTTDDVPVRLTVCDNVAVGVPRADTVAICEALVVCVTRGDDDPTDDADVVRDAVEEGVAGIVLVDVRVAVVVTVYGLVGIDDRDVNPVRLTVIDCGGDRVPVAVRVDDDDAKGDRDVVPVRVAVELALDGRVAVAVGVGGDVGGIAPPASSLSAPKDPRTLNGVMPGINPDAI